MDPLRLFTIGFTRKSAERFFTRLGEAGVRRVIDVRLNNTSQLAGFSKGEDLPFFLRKIIGAEYIHLPQFAPTQQMLDAYKKEKGDWSTYESQFLDLMGQRAVEASFPRELFEHACLLCSEDKPEHCHRRLVAEYLDRKWGQIAIVHL